MIVDWVLIRNKLSKSVHLIITIVCMCVCREKEKDVVGGKGNSYKWFGAVLIFHIFTISKIKENYYIALKIHLGILIEFFILSPVRIYFYLRLHWAGTKFSNMKMNYVIALSACSFCKGPNQVQCCCLSRAHTIK